MSLNVKSDPKMDADKKVSLQPVNHKRDHALLKKWISRSHVIEWWGDPDKIVEELSEPAIGGGEAIIKTQDKPVGYVRWQIPSRKELKKAGLADLPKSVIDIDIIIGEAGYLGQGIASRALKLLINQLHMSACAPMIMMCTSINNIKAIKCFEKAGFRKNRVFYDPEYGDMWLLTIDP